MSHGLVWVKYEGLLSRKKIKAEEEKEEKEKKKKRRRKISAGNIIWKTKELKAQEKSSKNNNNCIITFCILEVLQVFQKFSLNVLLEYNICNVKVF